MINSLNQRLSFFLLIPIALILFGAGLVGFFYIRSVILSEWEKASILKLQRAAHYIDMRLSHPIEWMNLFHQTGSGRDVRTIQEWILEQLRQQDGVAGVNLEWIDQRDESLPMMDRMYGMHGNGMMHRNGMMRFHRGQIAEVTTPVFNEQTGQETVDIVSELKSRTGRLLGKLKVTMHFYYLMLDIVTLGWWQSDLACLVDDSGRYLAHTKAMEGRKQLGETNDPVELAILGMMKEKDSGTYLGNGHLQNLVGGFYRIERTGWVLIMFAPRDKILQPVVKFRLYYGLAGIFCIFVILALIRFMGGKIVRAIGQLTNATSKVARGQYGKKLQVKSKDEIGELVKNFNAMVAGLKERDFIRNTFGRYVDKEIAQELMKGPAATRLGGERRQVAVLISDIRNFTTLSEDLNPDGTITILNHYFSHMIDVVRNNQGIIIDFVGDGILAFFDPFDRPVETAILRAVQCALDMQTEMKAFNEEVRDESLPTLEMGVAVNAGEVVVGNIGSEERAKYGIVGSAVNVTQRIQSFAKGGEVIVSESVHKDLPGGISVIRSFTTKLKGLSEEAKLYLIKTKTDPQTHPVDLKKGLKE